MTTCAQCQAVFPGEGVRLADGTDLCPACFERRFAQPNAPERLNAAEIFGYAKVAGMAATLLAIGFVSYRIYSTQNELNQPAHAAADSVETAAERERTEKALADLQRAVVERKRLDDVKREAEAQVARERALAELAAKKAAEDKRREETVAAAQRWREAKLDEQEERARAAAARVQQDMQVEKVKADLQAQQELADAAATRNAQSKAQQAKLAPLVNELAASGVKRADMERKMRAFNVQYETHKAVVDRLCAKHGKWITLAEETNYRTSSVIQPNADNLADYATYRENRRLALLERDEIKKLKTALEELDKCDKDANAQADEIKRTLSEIGASTREAKASGVTPLELAPAPKAPGERRTTGYKTLYKKDGTIIQIKSAIVVGDDLQYKDASGTSYTIKNSEVDRIERNDDMPANDLGNGVNKPGKGVNF
jgi:hypothetical protein